jgi:hypothetical protein
VLDQLLRRAQRGRLALPQAAAKLKDIILGYPLGAGAPAPAMVGTLGYPLAEGVDEIGVCVRQIRHAILYTTGQAWETLGEQLVERQEILSAFADMIAALYALESAWLRIRKMKESSALLSPASLITAIAAVLVYANDASAQVEQWGRYALAAFSAGDTLRTHAGTLRRLLKPPLLDTFSLRRRIAAAVLERDGYPW